MRYNRVIVIGLLLSLFTPVLSGIEENNVFVKTVEAADLNETIENINTTLNKLIIVLNELNQTSNETLALLTNLNYGLFGNETNISILKKLLELYTLESMILNAIGQPTNAEGNPINATVFSALSSIAVELYSHREALSTLGENQKNLSKYDQTIINNIDDRTQMVLGKIENESANIIKSSNNNFKAIAGSNSLAVSASIFTALIVAFFILIWEIFGLKNRFARKQEMYVEKEYAPGLAVKTMKKPDCFGDPDVFEADNPECQKCLFYDECERQALSEQAIRELQKSKQETSSSQLTQAPSRSFLDKFGV